MYGVNKVARGFACNVGMRVGTLHAKAVGSRYVACKGSSKAVESVCMTGCERATAEALVRGRVRSGGAVRGVVVSERLWTGWGKPTVGVVG